MSPHFQAGRIRLGKGHFYRIPEHLDKLQMKNFRVQDANFSGIFSWCGASMTCCPPGRWCTWGCLLWCCWCWYCCNSRSWWLGGRGNCWCPLSESPVFSLAALRRLLESLSPLPSERARGGFIVAGGTINWGGGSTTFPFSPRYFMVHSILALVVIGSDYRDRCLGPASFTSPPSSPSNATEETLWS